MDFKDNKNRSAILQADSITRKYGNYAALNQLNLWYGSRREIIQQSGLALTLTRPVKRHFSKKFLIQNKFYYIYIIFIT